MQTHKLTVEVEPHGNVLIFFEYHSKRLPTSGKERAYCPILRKVVEFDFTNILESEVMSAELV